MGNYDKESDSQSYWNEDGGSKWVENIDFVEGMLTPLNEKLISALRAEEGETVLDVGCGGGKTSIEIAGQVGSEGRVLGLDVSEPILNVARERGVSIGNLDFQQHDAASAELGSEQYDLITSRFGVMFFDDPVQAFSNLHGALKTTGRLVFLCWRGVEENPWLGRTAKAAFEIVPPADDTPPDPTAPGPFSLGDPAHLENILTSAGFSDVNLEAVDIDLPLGDLDTACSFLLKMGPAAEAIKDASDGDKVKVEKAIRDVLESFKQEKGIFTPSACWIARAGK